MHPMLPMLSPALSIPLAQDDGDGFGKIVFFLIFALLWALGSVVSWINKKQQEEKRRRMREQMAEIQMRRELESRARPEPLPQRTPPVMERPYATTMPPPPPPPMRPQPTVNAPPRRPVMVPQQQPQMRPTPVRPQPPRPVRRVQKKPAAPKPVIPPVVEEPIQASPSPMTTTPVASVSHPASQGAASAAIARWLTPRTLRSHYILTEVLQPPLALREPREMM